MYHETVWSSRAIYSPRSRRHSGGGCHLLRKVAGTFPRKVAGTFGSTGSSTVSSNQFDVKDPSLLDVATHVAGPVGSLPLTEEMLRSRPSGDVFGWTQNAGMGWEPSAIGGKEFLILSTHGGIRAPDGTPIALGYHTGHWEVGLLMEAAAHEFKGAGAVPFAAACTDPCDGRSQGTPAMFDSLAYRNDAATIFRRLIRSLPTRRGVLGVATCDKGLPAMMMALAGSHDLPCVLVPGRRDASPPRRRRRGTRADHRRAVRPRRALARAGVRARLPRVCVSRRRLPVPRHGRDLAGGRRGARPVARALGARTLGPPDLARHGAPIRPGADDARADEASR